MTLPRDVFQRWVVDHPVGDGVDPGIASHRGCRRFRRWLFMRTVAGILIGAVFVGGMVGLRSVIVGAVSLGARPTASLVLRPTSGNLPLRVTMDGSRSKAGKGATITRYAFDFGDGNKTGPQSKATVKHTYKSPGTYTVTLTVTNSARRTDQTTQDVKVTKPQASDPTAKLRVTPRSGPAPLQITASGSTSKAGKGATITRYNFNFDDGNKTGPQPKATVKHTYKSPGTYTVTLTVTNSARRTDQTTQDVKVTDVPPPKPVARLRVTRDGTSGYAGADGSASTAGQGATITSYDFDFGDGYNPAPQSEAKAKHSYKRPSPGEPAKTYTLKLTVTNSAGQTADVSQGVTVSPSSGPVTPSSGPGSGDGGKGSGNGDPPQQGQQPPQAKHQPPQQGQQPPQAKPNPCDPVEQNC
jgi:PKD repeat protein